MAVITESELREQWRHNNATRYEFPAGTRFSPSALDFINQWKLQVYIGGELLNVEATRISHYAEGGIAYLASKTKRT